MKKIIFLLPVIFLLSCASSTTIKTQPSGVKVYEGEALKGVTPYMHWDRAVGGSRTFTLKKEGYKDKTITVTKSEFNPIRLIAPPILAWPWLYGYPYEHYFELEEVIQNNAPSSTKPNIPAASNLGTQPSSSDSKYVQKLRELKKLKDEGLLTDKEYEGKKAAILQGM